MKYYLIMQKLILIGNFFKTVKIFYVKMVLLYCSIIYHIKGYMIYNVLTYIKIYNTILYIKR